MIKITDESFIGGSFFVRYRCAYLENIDVVSRGSDFKGRLAGVVCLLPHNNSLEENLNLFPLQNA